MKKMMIALMAVLITVALIGIGTYAYFSDTAVSNNNTITAGTLNFSILDPGNSGEKVFDVTGLEPGGDPAIDYLVVANDGSIDMKWRTWLETTSDPFGMAPYLTATWKLNPSEYNYAWLNTNGYAWGQGKSYDTLIWSQPLTALTANYVTYDGIVNGGYWPIFEPKNAAVVRIEVRLNSDAPNSLQGKSYEGNLKFEATQWINPGW